MPGPDSWIVAKSEGDGNPQILRLREAAPPFAAKVEFKHLVLVNWNYSSGVAGLPDAGTLLRMDRFEDLLAPLEGERVAALMAIFTGGGLRTWWWYARDMVETMAVVNRALAGEELLPLEFLRQDDPAWEEYHRLLRNLREPDE